MSTDTWFERAIFLSWYCGKADCQFCYMSTIKTRLKNPRLARRRIESILAEAIITKACEWKIEFLSGGYESYTAEELLLILKMVKRIYGKKLWLNIGVVSERELRLFKPYIDGVCGAVETINPHVRSKVCPSKQLHEIEEMLRFCDRFGLRKSITVIIGLGEAIRDIPLLLKFIKKHNLDKITFYRLNPHKGTPFKKGPDPKYYTEWIRKTREEFPRLEIIAGSWVDKLDEIPLLLRSGADALTKFPAIRLFNTKHARRFEELVEQSGRRFVGTMTKVPIIRRSDLKQYSLGEHEEGVFNKLSLYISRMNHS